MLSALILSSCSQPSTTPTQSPPASTSAAPPKPAATTAPVSSAAPTPPSSAAPVSQPASSSAPAAGQPVKGGVLRYGLNQEYPTIGNPATQQYSSGPLILDIALETLVNLDSQGNPIPYLATSWKADDAAPSLTMTLRQGVKFHDNTDFNAIAAKWNLDQIITAKKPELASVKSVDVVDNNTIKLNLIQPDGLLLTYLAGVRGQIMSPTAFQNSGSTDKDRIAWAESHPIGTGPFKLTSRDRDVKSVYTKFDGYWQAGKPYLDRIEFTVFADETTELAAFQKGDLDLMLTQQPQNVKLLEDSGKYAIEMGDLNLCGGLEGDSKHADSPWAKKEVRQAAAYAVDNTQFAKTMGYGYWQPTNQFDLPGRIGYNPDVAGYPYNPAKAKQLLAAAGYPSGFKTTIYGMPHYANMLASLQAYFKEVGITAESQIVTPAKRVEMFSSAGWNGLWLWECTVQPNTLVNMGRNFTAAAAPTRMISVDVPKEYSDLVSKAVSATDPAVQKSLTMQLEKDLVDRYAFITFIYGQYQPVPMSRKVHDFRKAVSMHWTPADCWLEK
jgi:peptide/nickel transport system substrate-binding protein